MRIQPCEAAPPMDASSAVPWMPAPSWKPSQRALMGLSGSFPAMTLPARSPAQAFSGTYHAGLAAMLSISYSPAGVANPAAPMPMRYVLASLPLTKKRSSRRLRLMAMKCP